VIKIANEKIDLESMAILGADIYVTNTKKEVYKVVNPDNYDVKNYKLQDNLKFYKKIEDQGDIDAIIDIIYDNHWDGPKRRMVEGKNGKYTIVPVEGSDKK